MKQYDLYIFDADGTLRECHNPKQPCPNKPDEWRFRPNVFKVILPLFDVTARPAKMGIASNQAGVAYGYLSLGMAFSLLWDLYSHFVPARKHAEIHGLIQLCPHAIEAGCRCRKPEPQMLLAIMDHANVPPSKTLYVGDMDSDAKTAKNAGCDFMWEHDFFGK